MVDESQAGGCEGKPLVNYNRTARRRMQYGAVQGCEEAQQRLSMVLMSDRLDAFLGFRISVFAISLSHS